MKLNELTPSVPRKARKRVGRGESSGWGKSAGKGSNGQNSRAGGGVKPYFEGGKCLSIEEFLKEDSRIILSKGICFSKFRSFKQV